MLLDKNYWEQKMFYSLKLLISLYFFNVIAFENVNDECSNSDDTDGTCVLVGDCPVALSSVRNKGYHNYKRCGFSGDIEIVCCPQTTYNIDSRSPGKRAEEECKNIVNSTTPPLDLYILNGEEANPGEFPHMVALGFDKGQGFEFNCGGSLISRDYILTAAHCVDTQDQIEPSIVRVGVIELGDSAWNDEIDFKIAEITKHPGYTRKEKYNDLALIRLQKSVKSSSNIHPGCLYTSSNDPKIPLTITGWGITSNKRNVKSNTLLKANVTVVSRSKCSESYVNWRKLPSGISLQQLCAGDSEGMRDTCQGDSGGPLQGLTGSDGQFRIIGITSFGRGCGSPFPGVYTRVSNYLDWIEGIVWSK